MRLIKTALLTLLTSVALYASSITVTDEYVREVPPNMPNSAAFMTIMNSSDKAIDLVEAKSNASKVVELHEHVNVEGMMQMRQIPKITVPANGSTQLQPGGLHVMLIGLNQKLKAGELVQLTLSFSNGETITLDAPVKKVAAGMMKHRPSCGSGKCGAGKCGSKASAPAAPAGKCASMKCGAGKCGK
ncbi:MAG: copper chaperone PCu(A)C [Sulfurimonadaceae bacterium]|nr:copper chaperone PCu(A)C [Sulfurimonadaceae bacterium]